MKKDDIGALRISRFNYHLPDEKIAKYPLPQRDNSKLLHYHDAQLTSFIEHPRLHAGDGIAALAVPVLHLRLQVTERIR